MIFFLLVLLALLLIVVLLPVGWLFAYMALIHLRSWSYFGKRNHDVAYSLDVLGGILYAEFFEFLFLTKKSKYRFVGNRKLTISAILGLNDLYSELNWFGYKFCDFLDWLDPNKTFGGHVSRAVFYELGEAIYTKDMIKEAMK